MTEKMFYGTICHTHLGFKNMTEKFENQIGKIHDSINKGQRQI